MAKGEFIRTAVHLAPVFYDGVSEIKNRAIDVGALSNRQQEPSDSKKLLLKMKKSSNCQTQKRPKQKNFTSMDRKFVHPRPRFLEGKT